MANTSLAKQLQRLAVPQTSILLRDKKRASLLFDSKDASNLDLETVLEIGLSGLHELQEIGGPEFNVFEKSLFDLTSVGVERAVLSKDTNDLLDDKINRFLALLSPYVLLQPAHRALEWLIQRFHIQEYNRDAFIFLFLPYHETKIFVRAIQLVNLSRESDQWHWLAAVHNSGSPISRGAVINQAASNNSFLAGLCDYVLFSVKVHKSEAGILSSLFAFYCTTLIGAVEGVKKKRKGGLVAAKEAQLQVILPCLLKGLSTSIPDFASASFMIVSSLARNGYLGLTLLHKIMNKVTKNCHSESVLIKELAILLAVICETQSSVIVNILPLSAVKKLLKNGVAILIIKELASVAKEVFVDKVSLALLAGILPLAKTSTGSDDLAPVARKVLDALISILVFEKDTSKEAIRFFVNSLIELMEKEREDKDSCDPDYSIWINEMLKSLENKYPTAFDAVVQRIIAKKDGVEDVMMTSVLGRILGLSVNREEYSGLMERLCHSDEGIRTAALYTLADVDVELFKKKEDLHSFVWVMEKRIQDDSPQVVLAVLSLKFLDSIIERDVMIKELILLLARSMEKTNTNKSLAWFDVILSSVKMLLSYGCEMVIKPEEESENTNPLLKQKVKILLAILPFLFPNSSNEVTLCKEVLKLSCSDPLLKGLWKELEGNSDIAKISSSVFDYLMNLHLLANEEGINDSDLVQVLISCGYEQPGNPVLQFMSLVILSGIVSCLTPNLKSTILKFSIDVFENAKATVVFNEKGSALPYKITAKSMDLCLSFAKKGYLPLQALLHSFSAVFQSYDSSWFPLDPCNVSDWWSLDLIGRENRSKGNIQLAIQIFDILISGCFLGKEQNSSPRETPSPKNKKLYVSCLKDFFEAHLPSIQHQLKFLSCLWVAHEVPVTVDETLNALIDVEKDTTKPNVMQEYRCLRIASTCKIAILPKLQVMALRLGDSLIHSSNSPISWLLESKGPGASIIPSALIACSSPLNSVRVAAIRLLHTMVNSVGTHLSKGCLYVPLLKELVVQSEEIIADPGQLSLFLYMHLSSDPGVLALHSDEKRKQMANIRDALFSLLDPKSPAPRHIIRALLHLLYGVRSLELLKKLSPLGMSLIEEGQTKSSLDEYAGDSLLFIINRFDDHIAESMADGSRGRSNLWDFFQKSLSDTHTKISLSIDVKQLMFKVYNNHSEEICPSILTMQQVTKEFFDGLPSNVYRAKTLSLLLDVAAQKNLTNSASVAKKLPLIEAASSAAKSAIKRLTLDAELIVEEFSKMLHSEDSVEVAPKTRTSIQKSTKRIIITMKTLQSQSWTRGVTLLEITQTKKKLKNAHRILPILFEILKGCLQLKHQEPVEYTKQLILACALHCLQKVAANFTEEEMDDEEESAKIDEHQFDAETIVQCIRSTQNPHTHRHALLLLSCAAELIPDCVLHNVMAIFAFVGTSMVRQDDEYSFEVITRTIESIVPVLVKVNPKMEGKTSRKIIPKLPEGMKYLEGPTVQGTLKVLRVFADAVPDVPTHRRLPLYHKLVETIGWEIGLPQLLLLVIEGQVLHSSGKEKEVDRSLDSRLELVHEFARKSPSYALVVCFLRMVQYIRFLPADKEAGVNGKLLWHSGQKHESLFMSYDFPHIFDVKNRSGNQLRHFKHAVLSILCSILSEPQIVAKLSLLDEKSELKDKETRENLAADELFQHLIQELLSYIAVVAGELESSASTRYWKAVQQRCHQILEKVNGLLPPSLFLSVVKGLLGHQLNSIQRKAADILNARLVLLLNENGNANIPLVEEDRAALREILLKPLMDMMDISEERADQTENSLTKDSILNCQVALLTAKLLIRILGSAEKSSTLKPILVRATKVASNALQMEEKSSVTFGGVLASAALCIAEICSVLKVKVIGELQNFMPVLLSALGSPIMENVSTSAVKFGVVTAVQRVVESASHFLSPYLRPLLVRLCLLACKHATADVPETSKESKGDPISMRLSSILNKVALAIPLRVLIPAVNDSFKILSQKPSLTRKNKKRKIEEHSDDEDQEENKTVLLCRDLENVMGESVCLSAIIPLMDMFSHNLSEMSHEELASHLQELELFFLSALDLRVEREGIEDDVVIDKAEESILDALVKLVLKLSEASFRPLFYRLFEWMSQEGASPLRAITFYRLSSKLAEALKGLFVLFAGNFIRHAADLLDKNNIADIGEEGSEKDLDLTEDPEENVNAVVKSSLFFGADDESGFKSHTLIKHILSTLGAVFLYDGTGQFVTRIRFETLMLPLVNQLENLVGGHELFQERCSSNLVPTLVQLAVSSADDSLWKQLNYQILLKTRHSNPKVRLAGLSALLELGKRLGEDFLPLLPETVPFLAELMEDEEEEVESATQLALNVLSDVLGEPLQKYF